MSKISVFILCYIYMFIHYKTVNVKLKCQERNNLDQIMKAFGVGKTVFQ